MQRPIEEGIAPGASVPREVVTSPGRESTLAKRGTGLDGARGAAAFVAKALGNIARATGMAQVACDVGLSRESLYKALSGERNPTLGTVLRVIGALA